MRPGPEQGGQWGILGGTFDPVHYGHLTLANEVRVRKKLTGVLLVPSLRHPFKKDHCQAAYADRVEMLKLAAEEYESFTVSEIEAEMNLSGYTLDTVRALKKVYPRTEFFFIMGADNLSELEQWHNPRQIFEEVKIMVGSRPVLDKKKLSAFPTDRMELIPTMLVNISSTEIRRRIRENAAAEELDKFMPPKVREYIQQKKLYL
ncbi:MAG: nicotinate-nucleotide adenylyltransferase [Candidatus Zixiibacteriota bacterium]